MKKPPAYTWYLPEPGQPDPEPRWRVVYGWEKGRFPVEVCAPTEEVAVMRAGMKRAELTRLGKSIFWDHHVKRQEFERLSVTLLCDCPCHEYHTGLIPFSEDKCGWCGHEVY